MEPVSETHFEDQRSQRELWRRVLALDPSHVLAAALRRELIHGLPGAGAIDKPV